MILMHTKVSEALAWKEDMLGTKWRSDVREGK